jgi:putative ABC transport system permease protein
VPHIYISEPQAPAYGSVVYLRTAADPGKLGDAIRRDVQAVDPAVPVFAIRTMEDVVARNLSARRFALELLSVFTAVAFLLAAIGIYGVMAIPLAGVSVKSAFVWRSAHSAATS